MIKGLDKLSLKNHEAPTHHETSSHNIPTWENKTLESVHEDETGKVGTRSSTRLNDGGNAYEFTSNSGNKLQISCDCELIFSSNDEPTSFEKEAVSDEWKEVMQKEYDSFIENETWKLVDPPNGIKPIGCKWVYKNKCKFDGSLDKHKVRLVAKGFAQKEGIDYNETLSYSKMGNHTNSVCLGNTKRM